DVISKIFEIEDDLKRMDVDYRFTAEARRSKSEVLERLIQDKQKEKEGILQELERSGVTDPRIRQLANARGFFAYHALENIASWLSVSQRSNVESYEIAHALNHNPLRFKLAEQPISSQEYWQLYFVEHGRQPSKIVWYDSSQTPTEAVQAFFISLKSSHEPDHRELDLKEMFAENLIGSHGIHERMQRERELIWKFAEEILEEWYPPSGSADDERAREERIAKLLTEQEERIGSQPVSQTVRKKWNI
ncbi:MAG: hypothetical protein Q8R07_05865, partial [Candidatus Uhrbacteria bacterium]|nr:hypothetical protein [Candidatus Uhrbacteria bacterium]